MFICDKCLIPQFLVGTVLGIYEDNRFRSESKKPPLKSVNIVGLGTGPEIQKKLKYAEDVCSGIIFGKELVNAPANVLTPGQYELKICYYCVFHVFSFIMCIIILYCAYDAVFRFFHDVFLSFYSFSFLSIVRI